MNWENVWLSPDGFMIDHPGSQDYVTAANYRLQDKILFGSLYPGVPLGYAVEKYRSLLREEVLLGNPVGAELPVKIVVDMVLFFISFQIQREFVYKKKA